MNTLSEPFSDYLMIVLFLIGLAILLTFVVFHWRRFFDQGYEKGEAADPDRVHRDNPPDEWAESHWKEPEGARNHHFGWSSLRAMVRRH